MMMNKHFHIKADQPGWHPVRFDGEEIHLPVVKAILPLKISGPQGLPNNPGAGTAANFSSTRVYQDIIRREKSKNAALLAGFSHCGEGKRKTTRKRCNAPVPGVLLGSL